MAALQSIRDRAGVIVSIIIGLALLAFIIGDGLNSGSSCINKSKNQAGEIAGEEVSIQDFEAKYKKNEEMAKNQLRKSSLSEEEQAMVRENTWEQYVQEITMAKEFEALGIEVSSEELYDITLGNNMSPALRSLFGNMDINQVRSIVKQINQLPAEDPNKKMWLDQEAQIIASRQMNKYISLLTKSLYITNAEAEEAVSSTAKKADISYIVKSYASISDSTINISNSEIKAYYDEHAPLFQQNASRRIAYVNFDVTPSAEDYSETKAWIEGIVNDFASATDLKEFVELSSTSKFDSRFFRKDQISNKELADFAFEGNDGVFGPYMEKDVYVINRVAKVEELPDSIKIRHILIQPERNDVYAAKNIADSIANLVRKGGDFEALAKQFSVDQNSAVNGGDLGWYRADEDVFSFSDSAFMAKENQVKVIPTQYGFHVVQIMKRAPLVKKVQIATITKEVIPSQATINKIYNDARTFATGINSVEDFDKKVADNQNISRKIAVLGKNDRTIAGINNARELVRKTYLADKENIVITDNDGSLIFDTGDRYTIAVLLSINEEGTSPINMVSSRIRAELAREKKAEMIKKELESVMAGSESLLSVSSKIGAEVKNAADVTFASYQIPGAGIEPNVVATVAMTEMGKMSAPIKGNQGVYVIMVDNVENNEIAEDAKTQAKIGLSQANYYRMNSLMEALKKNADVQDNRYKFY